MFWGHAQPVQHALFGGVGGGKNLGTEVAGDLNGGLPHSPGAGVDQYPLPLGQPSDLDQNDVGGQERHRNRGRLGKRPPRRDDDHRAVVGDGGGRQSVGE